MRTDGIQAARSEPDPENAPPRMGLPQHVEQLTLQNKGYVVHYHDRVSEEVDRWGDARNHRDITMARSFQLRRGKTFLEFIERCLSEYLAAGQEEGTLDMLESVEQLLKRTAASLEPQRDASDSGDAEECEHSCSSSPQLLMRRTGHLRHHL